MKIAIPVEGDDLKIVKRTGQAPYFAIFEDTELERIVEAPQGHAHDHHEGHDHGGHEEHIGGHGKSLVNIADCDLMLVQAIGEHMSEAVKRVGITVKKIRQKDGEYANEAVASYLAKGRS